MINFWEQDSYGFMRNSKRGMYGMTIYKDNMLWIYMQILHPESTVQKNIGG